MSKKQKTFPHLHFIDHKSKWIYIHVASGWPACYALPYWKKEYFSELEGYGASLCKEQTLKDLIANNSVQDFKEGE